MKILVSVIAFALTLALTAPSTAKAAGGGGGSAADHHKVLTEKMNALFPPPKQNLEARIAPKTPELAGPAYLAQVSGGTANLQWKAVPTADEYHVQVATDPNFKWLVANEYHVKQNSFEARGLEAGKQYFWRVAAVKTTNWVTFRRSFFATSTFETSGAN